MVGVVAVVVLLDHDQEPPEFDHVQLEELYQAILVQQVKGEGDQAVSLKRTNPTNLHQNKDLYVAVTKYKTIHRVCVDSIFWRWKPLRASAASAGGQ